MYRLNSITSWYVLMAILCIGLPVQGVVLKVPGQYSTIQSAIDAAETDDTVLLSDGEYEGRGNYDLSYQGKDITVQSETGPDGCIIRCGYLGRGFIFNSGETSDAHLSGITVERGYGEDGGGAACIDASPTIDNCIFASNTGLRGGALFLSGSDSSITGCLFYRNDGVLGGALHVVSVDEGRPTIDLCSFWENHGDQGGAIYTADASMIIKNCDIRDNTGCNGGALYGEDSQIQITDTAILRNTAAKTANLPTNGCDGGGGAYYINSKVDLLRCNIESNRVRVTDAGFAVESGFGGGLAAVMGTLKVIDCVIIGNSRGWGNGIYCRDSSLTAVRCYIAENAGVAEDQPLMQSLFYGGGVYAQYMEMINTIVAYNTADFGGGIYCAHGDKELINCTITQNTATTGGGLYNSGSNDDVRNSIFWQNFPDQISAQDGDTRGLNVNYSIISRGAFRDRKSR